MQKTLEVLVEDQKAAINDLERALRHEQDRGKVLDEDKKSLNLKIRELEASLNTMDLMLCKILDRVIKHY